MAADAKALVRGFTLVELMIVMAIMSMVTVSATYAFSLFSRDWEVRRGGFDKAKAQLRRLELVESALQNTLPWAVWGDDGRVGYYFLGREEGLTVVTASPVFAADRPAVIRVFGERESPTTWRLVYEEAPLTGVLLRRADQELPFQHRLVVVRGLSDVRFKYYGWLSLQDRMGLESDVDSGNQNWFSEYDGMARVQQPEKIALVLGGAESVISMPIRNSVLSQLAGE
jgi:prepilin-type N-terminal cleavage/methylation domain-containing protein